VTRLRAIVYGLRRALRGAAARPTVTLLSTGVVAVSLLLVGVVALAAANVSRLTARWGRGVQMVVYLKDGTTPERARAVGQILASVRAIERVDYVPPDEAYRRLAESLGTHRELLEGVEAGFLPGSLEIRLREGVRDLAGVSPIVERLRRTPGVEEVDFLGDWVDRLARLLLALRAAGVALTLLIGGACVYVIAGTIKLGMYARKDEIDVLRLVGATDGFVELPLVVEGALVGSLGAAAGAGLLYLLYHVGGPMIEGALSSAIGEIHLQFLSRSVLAAALGGGTILGLLGSWLAIGRRALA
jgi:cell division transport system permease protein